MLNLIELFHRLKSALWSFLCTRHVGWVRGPEESGLVPTLETILVITSSPGVIRSWASHHTGLLRPRLSTVLLSDHQTLRPRYSQHHTVCLFNAFELWRINLLLKSEVLTKIVSGLMLLWIYWTFPLTGACFWCYHVFSLRWIFFSFNDIIL